MWNTNNVCEDQNKMMQASDSINKIYGDTLDSWHALNERMKKSGPVGDWTRAFCLPDDLYEGWKDNVHY